MFIFYPRKVGVGLYNAVVQACESAGFTPTEGIEAPQLTSVVTFVAAGMGVSVIPATISQLQAEGACYFPLTGQAPIPNPAHAYRRKAPSNAPRYPPPPQIGRPV